MCGIEEDVIDTNVQMPTHGPTLPDWGQEWHDASKHNLRYIAEQQQKHTASDDSARKPPVVTEECSRAQRFMGLLGEYFYTDDISIATGRKPRTVSTLRRTINDA